MRRKDLLRAEGMGVIRVECPHCAADFNLDSALAGEAVACPECGEVFTAPSASPGRAPAEAVQQGGFPSARPRPGKDSNGAFSVRIGRSYGGDPGCCCGVIMGAFILFVALAVRGCLSLF